MGYSPWGRRELGTTEGVTTHTHTHTHKGTSVGWGRIQGPAGAGTLYHVWVQRRTGRGDVMGACQALSHKEGAVQRSVALVESAPGQQQARRQWVEYTPQPLSLSTLVSRQCF